jgi:aminoglycoside N3'-acetyltransferase
MGAIAAAVVQMPGRSRGNHPICSFAAVGPHAQSLVAHQSPLAVNAPLAALADCSGYVVLMGVGLNCMTLLHLAEQQAGRNLFRHWAKVWTAIQSKWRRAAVPPVLTSSRRCLRRLSWRQGSVKVIGAFFLPKQHWILPPRPSAVTH